MDKSENQTGSPAKLSDTCSIASSESNMDQAGNGAIKSRSKARRMRRQKRGSELLAIDGKSTKKKKLHVFEAKMKTQLCKHWQKGFCNKISDCIFAHGHHELRMPESKSESRYMQVPVQGYPGYPPYGFPPNGGYMEHPPPPARSPFPQHHLGYGYPHGGYGQMMNSAPLHAIPAGSSSMNHVAPPSMSMGAVAYPSMQPSLHPAQPTYGQFYEAPFDQQQQSLQQQNGYMNSAFAPQQQQGASLAHTHMKSTQLQPSSYAVQRAANPVPMGHMISASPLAVSAESFNFSQQGANAQNSMQFYPSANLFPSENQAAITQSVGSASSGMQNQFPSTASPANKTNTWAAPASTIHTPPHQQKQQQQHHQNPSSQGPIGRLNGVGSPHTDGPRPAPEEELLLTGSPYAGRSSLEGPPPIWFTNPSSARAPVQNETQQWVLEGQALHELSPSYLEQVNNSMMGSVLHAQQYQKQQQAGNQM